MNIKSILFLKIDLIFFFRIAFVFVIYYLLQDILMRNISKEDRGTCSVFTIGEIFCNNTLIEVVRSRINYLPLQAQASLPPLPHLKVFPRGNIQQ